MLIIKSFASSIISLLHEMALSIRCRMIHESEGRKKADPSFLLIDTFVYL